VISALALFCVSLSDIAFTLVHLADRSGLPPVLLGLALRLARQISPFRRRGTAFRLAEPLPSISRREWSVAALALPL
jgi:hypothetical protein